MKALANPASTAPAYCAPLRPACDHRTRLSPSRTLSVTSLQRQPLHPAPERRKHIDSPSFRRAPQRDETPRAEQRPPDARRSARRPRARTVSATSET